MISKFYGYEIDQGERQTFQLKLKVVVGVCNYIIFLANAELARSFSKMCVWNHQTFQNSCAESSKVHVQNHQDNYFLINVAEVMPT